MKFPLAPALLLAALAATAVAVLHDLTAIAGAALRPWFGWMLP